MASKKDDPITEFSDKGPQEPTALGDAAQEALADLAGDGVQEELPETAYAHVKFTGMAFESLMSEREIRIGDTLRFQVEARCIGVGDEASKRDSTAVKHVVKMDVQTVTLAD